MIYTLKSYLLLAFLFQHHQCLTSTFVTPTCITLLCHFLISDSLPIINFQIIYFSIHSSIFLFYFITTGLIIYWEVFFPTAPNFQDVQKNVAAIIKNKILVGHSIATDLKVIFISLYFLFICSLVCLVICLFFLCMCVLRCTERKFSVYCFVLNRLCHTLCGCLPE